MSIIKNSNGTTNTYVTARSFHDITLGTALDRTGQLWTVLHYIRFMSTSSAPAYYLPLNSPLYSQDTIQILARIPSSANGYFFGAGTMTINKSGNTVTWTSGSNTATATVTDWDNFHIFGFVEGKPMLDLSVLASWIITDGLVASAGAWYGACSGQTDNITQIDIQRINIYGKSSTSASAQRMQKAYYPMIRLDSTTSLGFFEARRRRTGVNATGLEDTTNFHTSSSSYAYSVKDEQPDTVTYGIQLDDLHVIFGNGYHDLIPTVCADGGIDDGRGWDGESASDPFVVSGKSFAFNLKGIPLAGTPISGTGVTGELMTGRKPMWSIYADNNKFGFHVLDDNGIRVLHFNICKDYKGERHKPDYDQTDEPKVPLELFDGYNNGAIHAPSLTVPSIGDIEYHNGYPVTCKIDMEHCLVGPYREEGLRYVLDKNCVFKLTPDIVADVKGCIGNLAPWNYTRTQLGETLYAVYGMAISMYAVNDNLPVADIIDVVSGAPAGGTSLSSETDSTIKSHFQNENTFAGGISLNKDGKMWLFNALKDGNSVEVTAHLSLPTADSPTATEWKFINVDNFIRPVSSIINGAIDTATYTGTESNPKWRTVIDDQIRRTYSNTINDITFDWTDVHVGIMGTVNTASYTLSADTVFDYGGKRYVSIPFLPCKTESERSAQPSGLGTSTLPIRDTSVNDSDWNSGYKFVVIFEAFSYADGKISEYKFLGARCVKFADMTETLQNASGAHRGSSVIKFDQSETASLKYCEFNRLNPLQWDGVSSRWQWYQSGIPATHKNEILDYYVQFAIASAHDLNLSQDPDDTDVSDTLSDNTTVIAHIYSNDDGDTPHFVSGLVNGAGAGEWIPQSQTVAQFYDSANGLCLLFPEYSLIMEQSGNGIFGAFCCIWKRNGNTWTKQNVTTWPKPSVKVYRRTPDGEITTFTIPVSNWNNAGTSASSEDENETISISVMTDTYEPRYKGPDGNYRKNDSGFYVTITDSTTAQGGGQEYRSGYTYYILFGAS